MGPGITIEAFVGILRIMIKGEKIVVRDTRIVLVGVAVQCSVQRRHSTLSVLILTRTCRPSLAPDFKIISY